VPEHGIPGAEFRTNLCPAFAPRHVFVPVDDLTRASLCTSNALQTITNFCSFVGADGKMRAGLIGLAKQNGNTLGFLS